MRWQRAISHISRSEWQPVWNSRILKAERGSEIWRCLKPTFIKSSGIQFVFNANFWFNTSCVQRDSSVIIQKLTTELWLVFHLYSEYYIIVTLNVAFSNSNHLSIFFRFLEHFWTNFSISALCGTSSASCLLLCAFPPQQFARLGMRCVPTFLVGSRHTPTFKNYHVD